MYLVKVASNLSDISLEYYKFANIFSKSKDKVFAPYYAYDLKNNLKENIQHLSGIIYSLLVSKQKTLKKFIKKNLNMNSI